MWHRYAVVSALTLASNLGFVPTASAQTTSVPFSGTVPVQVTFSNVATGTAQTTIASGSAASPSILESATSATVTVKSNAPAIMTVSSPYLLSGPTPDPAGTKHVTSVSFGSTNATNSNSGQADVAVAIPAGITDVEIEMFVERPVPYPAGTYNYGVTMTVTP